MTWKIKEKKGNFLLVISQRNSVSGVRKFKIEIDMILQEI
jgi:hypothetical protein